MTNENESQRPPQDADERARRIAEARARAEAARQARAGGGAPAQPPAQETTPPSPEPAAAAPETGGAAAAPPAAEQPAAASAGGEDERARRIAEARARAEAARAASAGGAAPAQQPAAATPPPAAETQPAPAAPAAAARAEGAPESGDDRAARIAAARARAQQAAAARAGGAEPPPAAPQRSPEEEAARQARLEEARARAAAATGGAPAAQVPATTAATAAPAGAVAPAARTAVAPVGRAMPSGMDEWRAPAAGTRVVTARPSPEAVAERELSRQDVANIVTRRSMLRTSFWAALGVTLAGFLLGFVNFFWPRKVTGFGGIVQVPATSIPQPGGDPIKVFEAKAWIVNLNPGEGVPSQFTSFAAPSEKGGILALYQKCPHLGCSVPWRAEFDFEGVRGWFRCPCHGSTYTKAGVRVFGPAPRPMDTFEVTPGAGGGIQVNTGKITLGAPDNPQRTIQLT